MRWSLKDWMFISISFFIGFVLTIIPLPMWAVWFRPAWVMLILMYWLISVPHRFGIIAAWVVGILMDLLTGTPLGVHALVFTLLAFFILKFRLLVRGLSLWQKLLFIMAVQTLYLSVQYWIMADNNVSSEVWKYWMPVLTTMICWPWVSLLLRDFQHRFGVR